ncbi:MAG: addiction module protein [Chloroflexi bacterium]|nr:addiction module protein [Chloroflexota bacterium]
MSISCDELKEAATQLSESERAQLALALLESLEPSSDCDVEQAWNEEALRRADEVRRGVAHLVPGDDVFAQIRHGLE